MNRLCLTTVTAALMVGAALLSGCQSDPHGLPKLEREPTFGRTGDREDFEIRVQISPVERRAHWYKMESVLIQRRAGGDHPGQDRISIPTLQAAVGANAVSYQFSGPEPGAGPRVWFKVYEQEGKLIAEYEVGYGSKEGDSVTRKGRLILKAIGSD